MSLVRSLEVPLARMVKWAETLDLNPEDSDVSAGSSPAMSTIKKRNSLERITLFLFYERLTSFNNKRLLIIEISR